MADETKNPNQPNQPKPSLEVPKDIEDLLKDLPKINPERGREGSQRASASYGINTPKPSPLMPPKPLIPLPSSQPTPPSFKPLIPEPPKSPPSLIPPKPVAPSTTPSSPTNQQDKFKSLIRTMGEDLEAAKKVVKPESKPFEIKPPPTTPKPITPPPLKTPPPSSEIKLGPAERTKSLDLPAKTPFTDVTRAKKSSIGKILILILGIGIVSAGVWYFMTKQEKIATPIPTYTPTPTLTPKTLSELIPSSSQITISSTENFLTGLNNGIKSATLMNGEWIALKIINENGTKYSLDQIFQRLNITLPNGVLENLDSVQSTLAVYGQREMYDSKGILSFNPMPKPKLSLIAKTDYPSSLRSALNNWELTMTDGLKNLFEISPQKTLAQTFLDNIYNGTEIRYRNFSYADSSIDYTILNLLKFNSNYLILTSSRESIYSAIDLLQNQ